MKVLHQNNGPAPLLTDRGVQDVWCHLGQGHIVQAHDSMQEVSIWNLQ